MASHYDNAGFNCTSSVADLCKTFGRCSRIMFVMSAVRITLTHHKRLNLAECCQPSGCMNSEK